MVENYFRTFKENHFLISVDKDGYKGQGEERFLFLCVALDGLGMSRLG